MAWSWFKLRYNQGEKCQVLADLQVCYLLVVNDDSDSASSDHAKHSGAMYRMKDELDERQRQTLADELRIRLTPSF